MQHYKESNKNNSVLPFKNISALNPINSAITVGKSLWWRLPNWADGGTGQNRHAGDDGSDGANDSSGKNGGSSGSVNGAVVAAGVAVVSAEAADHQQDFTDSLLSTHGDGYHCL